MERYNFNSVEKKWQKLWQDNNVFKSEIDQKKEKNFKPYKGEQRTKFEN